MSCFDVFWSETVLHVWKSLQYHRLTLIVLMSSLQDLTGDMKFIQKYTSLLKRFTTTSIQTYSWCECCLYISLEMWRDYIRKLTSNLLYGSMNSFLCGVTNKWNTLWGVTRLLPIKYFSYHPRQQCRYCPAGGL